MNDAPRDTAWIHGRFDRGHGPPRVLFGRMYEDPAIELSVFEPGGRVFCIASAGCMAMALSRRHDVVAADINPAQLAYAAQRIAGAPMVRGTAERLMSLGRALLAPAGWRRSTLNAFLDLDDPAAQRDFWKTQLDTRRFRTGIDALFSLTALRTIYSSRFLDFLPDRFGAVMRSRLERCVSIHPNRTNPWLHALLAGGLSAADLAAPQAAAISLVQGDAASFLEGQPAGSLNGFTLSNILDGASESYRRRLFEAVAKAAAPGAMVVLRSFREPEPDLRSNRAADDRSPLWGVIDVRPATALEA